MCVMHGVGSPGEGGTWDESKGAPGRRFFQTPRIRGAVEAQEGTGVEDVAPATQRLHTALILSSSLRLARGNLGCSEAAGSSTSWNFNL